MPRAAGDPAAAPTASGDDADAEAHRRRQPVDAPTGEGHDVRPAVRPADRAGRGRRAASQNSAIRPRGGNVGIGSADGSGRHPSARRHRSVCARRMPVRETSDRAYGSARAGRRDRRARRRRHGAAACAGSTCWPGATSTTPTPVGRSCTPTSSCAAGPTPGWRSSTARRPPPASRPRPGATATTCPAGQPLHGVPAHDGVRADRADGPLRRARSRSGTACRGSRRCGTGAPT